MYYFCILLFIYQAQSGLLASQHIVPQLLMLQFIGLLHESYNKCHSVCRANENKGYIQMALIWVLWILFQHLIILIQHAVYLLFPSTKQQPVGLYDLTFAIRMSLDCHFCLGYVSCCHPWWDLNVSTVHTRMILIWLWCCYTEKNLPI